MFVQHARQHARQHAITMQRLFHSKLNAVGISQEYARCMSSSPESNKKKREEEEAGEVQDPTDGERLRKLRNFGISAHIDSGKTTLTERILFYTGKINQMHEVKGGGDKGATMDSMDLERERGITIQSAATYVSWQNHNFNIIDTPGHVDFTIEVERALRVLDGAILVVCAVGNVQSQTMTVDRQMKRYKVPRVVFVNKLDRTGANPISCVKNLKAKLHLNAAMIQIPMWNSADVTSSDGTGFDGLIDLVKMKTFQFRGSYGSIVEESDIPSRFLAHAEEMRKEMIERLAEVDETIGDMLVMDEKPNEEQLQAAIRRGTLSLKFVPVMMGSAYKNQGVQLLLDAIIKYLPNPTEVTNFAIDNANNGKEVLLSTNSTKPFVGLAFKLDDTKFGQLTYMRIYQGCLRRGDNFYNVNDGQKVRVPRLVRMHANQMEDVNEIKSGEICAIFGLECKSGDTFTSSSSNMITLTSMHVPESVISLAISVVKKDEQMKLSKALNKFTREDPTFRVSQNEESGQLIISGMGELHLEIYMERLKREFGIIATADKPQVAYRESIRKLVQFSYQHKKQTGGAGQYAKVEGYIEPITDDEREKSSNTLPANVFVNEVVGGVIPTNFIPACEKGFIEACDKGTLIGFPIVGCRVVLNNGAFHAVDSSELAFRLASIYAFRQAYESADAIILEPIMLLNVQCPSDFQGTVIGMLNKRKGVINKSDTENDSVLIECDIPLANIFNFATELRSATQGKGEFTLEFAKYQPVPYEVQLALAKKHQDDLAKKNK